MNEDAMKILNKCSGEKKKEEDLNSCNLLEYYKKKYSSIDIEKAKLILKEQFLIPHIKEKQLECLNCIKRFEHVLNIMPTGGGKSLIYQLIPLILDGISIVISPLISLIQDQIISLRNKKIVAETINSSLNKKENERILDILKRQDLGNLKVLYITPETATSVYFMDILYELYINKKISLISIDEVHCISTWGSDFRKSYRNLNKVLDICPYVRTYCCTATATKFVEKDIIRNLNFYQLNKDCDNNIISNNINNNIKYDDNNNNCKVLNIVRTSFNRPNLKYIIIYSDLIKDEKKNSVCDIINEKRNKGKIGIIYCFKRNTCDEISKYLREKGINALSYHAGLTNNTRKRIQQKWISGKTNILVATIAFGMGIDRKDVSFIIHYNLPKSIENYYQESGRCGRNGNISFCYLFYSKEDVEKLSYIIKTSFAHLDMHDANVEKKYEKEIYNLECVHNLCINEKCIRSQILSYFGETYPNKNLQKNNSSDHSIETHKNQTHIEKYNFDTVNIYHPSDQNKHNLPDEHFCCSFCYDTKGSRIKIQNVINLYENKKINNISQFYSKGVTNEYNYLYNNNGKHKLYDDDTYYSPSDEETREKRNTNYYNKYDDKYGDRKLEEGIYKLNNKKIKGYIPFQSASSIIPKQIRDKGIVEVMKELEKREEELNEKTKNDEEKHKINKMNLFKSNSMNVKRKHVFSSFKIPRKI
ncbi:ATP-dependent DNA helicase Q1 [Plasmodium sp. DRC-Itaito]|nr:ATP-dependent DNA helicase Q1 [Plasmodium sp. DRC-Itaito]